MQKDRVQRACELGTRLHAKRVMYPSSMETEASVLGTLPDPTLHTSFIWLFILYNKLVNVSLPVTEVDVCEQISQI